MRRTSRLLDGLRQWLRWLNGDSAYEAYLRHCARRHPGQPVLDRAAFFRAETARRWNGIRRCC